MQMTEEQRKGLLFLDFWLRQEKCNEKPRTIDRFFIQKIHDLAEWMVQVTSNRLFVIENDFKSLEERISKVELEQSLAREGAQICSECSRQLSLPIP